MNPSGSSPNRRGKPSFCLLSFGLVLVVVLSLARISWCRTEEKAENDLVFDEEDGINKLKFHIRDPEPSVGNSDSGISQKRRRTSGNKLRVKGVDSFADGGTINRTKRQFDDDLWSDEDEDSEKVSEGGGGSVDGILSAGSSKTTTSTTSRTTSKSNLKNAGNSVKATTKRLVTKRDVGDDEDLAWGSGDSGLDGGSGELDIGGRIPDPAPEINRPPTTTTSTTTEGQPGLGFGDKKFFRVALDIQKTWSPALESSSSSIYRLAESEMEEALKKTEFDPESIQVVSFTNINDPVYVRCIFDIGLTGYSKDLVESEFLNLIDIGRIHNIRIRRDGFSIRDLGAPREDCISRELQCKSGQCVPLTSRCDGTPQCDDASDEWSCPIIPRTTTPTTTTTTTTTSTTTPSPVPTRVPERTTATSIEGAGRDGCRADDQVRCADENAIICSDQLCDGVPDCPDGDDERNCTGVEDGCPRGQFLCDLASCKPDRYRCNGIAECRDGTDEAGCPSGQCLQFEWECDSGDCIPRELLCDGRADCLNDRSDEKYCSHNNCTANEFRCRYSGTCIKLTLRCDGQEDCGFGDNSDEEFCSCNKTTEFRCDNDFCLRLSQRCDGIRQCNDGSDEKDCPLKNCTTNEFRCDDGTCVPLYQRCNNRNECPDRSDEANCPRSCRRDEFTCRDGTCLSMDKRCNRRPDCLDGDDEIGCGGCTEQEFTCNNGNCIDRRMECDGELDCTDGSDEDPLHCGTGTGLACNAMQFRCDDGMCLPKSVKCNGRSDCRYGEDEFNCTSCSEDEYQCETGGCIELSKLCDYIPDCEDGDDEVNCTGICSVDQVLCGDGKCVNADKKCDGRYDCIDGVDEIYCDSPSCPPGYYRCSEGTCIRSESRCDGRNDCLSGSDEQDCTSCAPTAFRCRDGKCIDQSYICDRRRDCRDGFDEENCEKCEEGEFQCDDGKCIASEYRCDSVVDCADSSDEQGCRDTEPPRSNCTASQFSCQAGGCVPLSAKCNAYFDCADGSDELDCNLCRSNEFRCANGNCVPDSRRCDGIDDCDDNSDEKGCPPRQTQCQSNEFTCRSRDQCVPMSSVCNRIYDCNDFSDEESCSPPVPDIGTPGGLNLRTYPTDQSIKQGNEVVFQCRDEGPLRVPVRWLRGNGLPLPPGSSDKNGRLEMPNIAVDHTGTYICEALGYSSSAPGARVSVYLRVDPYELPPTRPPNACGVNEATCASGECIAKNLVCDGHVDCADSSDEMRCRGRDGCEPNEFRCGNKRCVPKTWRCDGDDDCGDNSDEYGCIPPPPGSPCRYNEFQCATGNQCIPKAFHCDREIDCADRSDESGCTPPVIQKSPLPLVTLDVGDVFNMSCSAVGIPTPEIVWRLNWGHIPEKCATTSTNGVGVITCSSIEIRDQGAYSCESINSLGSTFAIPDCILVVKTEIGLCTAGAFNDLATNPQECVSCFCFGQSSVCDSANMYITELPPPEPNYRLVGVVVDGGSGVVRIQTEGRSSFPSSAVRPYGGNGVQASTPNTRSAGFPTDVIPYFALPSNYIGEHLKSYGGHLRYNLRYRGSGRYVSAPDVIISGNGITLLYFGEGEWSQNIEHSVSARYWAGEWYKRGYVRPGSDKMEGIELASREEIMMVLANVEHLLIRAKYDEGFSLDTTVSGIRMETAGISNTGLGQAVYVEECRCPPGYTGLSCQDCAPGYSRKRGGSWLGTCVPDDEPCPDGYYSEFGTCKICPCPDSGRNFGTSCFKDTDGEVTCNCIAGHAGRNCDQCSPGYERSRDYPYGCRSARANCDVEGSVSPTPDPRTGRCICKDYATGATCSECKEHTFYLNSQNLFGCINCFCMGVTKECSSSSWYRTQETATFVQNNHNFILIDESQRDEIKEGFSIDRNSRELGFKEFSRYKPNIYYWQLPYNFLGDKVTAYGGYLNYTVRYIPPPGGQNSPNSAADVEISGNDIRLLYFRKVPVSPNRQETISVPFLEQYWQRQDGQTANREHLLMALANLDALLIKATYTTSTREAHISDITFDVATSRNTGQERAYAVEKCACPVGYTGLSCQECAFGYTRSLRGLYLGLCEPCSCNDHSDDCDPKTGICRNCRGYTTGDYCEQCEDGFIGDPRTGECKRDTTVGPPQCSCDARGSTSTECPDGRNCVCKGNVEGQSCNICRRGTFALQEDNPQGCLQCYCSGISTECSSATLYRASINADVFTGDHGFKLVNNIMTVVITDITVDSSTGELSYRYPTTTRSDRLFWSLPAEFTGNRIASYGGKLRAARRYYLRPGGNSRNDVDVGPSRTGEDIDVILMGNNGVSLFWIFYGSLLSAQEVALEVSLRETAGWRHITGASRPANREDILGVLADLKAILIRASFTDDMESTHIKDVSLDDAVRQDTPNGIVMEVEECRCPAGYDGLSCESCSSNYYRDPSDRSRGAYTGTCKPCPCGSNSEGCRYEDGRPVCICKPGFSGPNCDIRDRVIVELYPVKVNSYYGRVEEFICSYKSRLPLSIEFHTFPEWNWLKSNLPYLGYTLPEITGNLYKFGVDRTWESELKAKIPILPQMNRVYCRISDENGTVVAEVFANINADETPEPPTPPGGGGPQIQVYISEPIIQVAQVGSSVTFRCQGRALGGSPVRVTWGKENGLIPPGRARDDGNGLLVITEVRAVDSGTYICSVTDGRVTSTQRAVLNIRGGPSPSTPARPEVSILRQYERVSKGDAAEFSCSATGFPVPSISWTGGRGGNLPSHARVENGILRIPNVRKSDEAEYICTASNFMGTDSQQAVLYVDGEDDTEDRSDFDVTIVPSSYDARPGETVRFRCDSSDYSARKAWSRISGGLPPSASESGDGTLSISGVSEADSGIYVCGATNADGKIAQSQVRLSVSYIGSPPVARIEPERQTVAQGSLIELRCIASGNPSPTIEWSKVGSSLSRSIPTTNEILRIPSSQVSDRGVYVCTVENSVGKTLASAVVEVERREPPQIELYPNGRQTIVKEGSALFQCRVIAGIPSPKLSWSRGNGLRIPANVEEMEGGVLRFNQVTGEEKGQYVCSASNLAGTTTAIATLDIQSPPRVTITPNPDAALSVRAGEYVRLECRAEGEPLPMVQWEKLRPGAPAIQPSRTQGGTPQIAIYEIRRVSKDDEGSYSCLASNEAGFDEGRIQLFVDDALEYAPPTSEFVRPTEEVYQFPVGSRAELRCYHEYETTSFSSFRSEWTRSDYGPMPASYEVQDGMLYINDLRERDAGRYHCNGTDRTGRVVFTSDARLEVIGFSPPRIELRPPKQTVRRGDTVNIDCYATGEQPITIQWSKINKQQPFPPSVIVNGPRLTFRGIEVSDAGKYQCLATNAGGYAEAVAEVLVSGGGGTPSLRPSRRDQTAYEGSAAELDCQSRGRQSRWRKENSALPVHAIPLGSKLKFINLQVSDSGRYICESDDGAMDVIDLTVEGLEPVAVRITPNRGLYRIGEDVEVRCEISGGIPTFVQWAKVDGQVGPNVQTISNVLRVTDLMAENGGIYRCNVQMGTRNYQKDFALTIEANPEPIQNSAPIETKMAPFGSTVTMDCQTFLDAPVVYTWHRQGGLISSDATTQGPSLTIPDVSPEDAGAYICSASNQITSVDVPTVLVVTGVVPYFAQAPQSYMVLPTLPDAYLKFDIEISFKPEDNNGLILYNGQKKDGGGDFFSFGLTNGTPEFRFDVGSGPAVIRADHRVTMGEWHTVKLSRDRTEGNMIVDDQGPYLGSIKGNFQGLDLIDQLYVGGVSNFNAIHRLAGHTKGFVGCISELIIGGKKQQLLRDAQTSRGVSTCDTCDGNTCKNGGVCQEGLTNKGYSCICPPGYSGDECETPGQACYPGACGIGKCVNVPGGFECYCPFGKTGVRCERDVVIFEPAFTGESFLAYPTPKALKALKMSLKIKPSSDSDALLMYCSQTEEGNGDYTALAIKDRHLEFQYDTGSGPAVIRSTRAVKVGEWMNVTLERQLQDGELLVDGEEVVKGKSPGITRGLNLKTPLYLGGFDRQRVQLNSHLRLNKGFSGCVSEIAVTGMDLDIVNSVLEGANVENCASNVQDCRGPNPCLNNGKCRSNVTHDFYCECVGSYTGRYCETLDNCASKPCKNGGVCHLMRNTYKCACLQGFHGRDCEKKLEFTESVAFRGEGYLELNQTLLPHTNPSEPETVTIELSTTSPHGLILWHGQPPSEVDPDDFMAVGLHDGKVEFRWELGAGEGKVTSSERVDDGKKHKIVIKRQGADGSIELDDGPPEFTTSPGLTQALNTRGNIYLGGLPNPIKMTHGKYSDGFVGCIHAVRIQSPEALNLNQSSINVVNVGPCSEHDGKARSIQSDQGFFKHGSHHGKSHHGARNEMKHGHHAPKHGHRTSSRPRTGHRGTHG